jgi:deoxyribodipyrimidine photo-lyase
MDRLEAFLDGPVPAYHEDRNRPDLDATSRLSPHLHFGEISPRQALTATRAAVLRGGRAGLSGGAEHFLREIGWREFNHHLLYHYPHTTDAPLDRRFAELVWRTDAKLLGAWQRGRTGYPIVDAGMRELWHTGYMHNRVRMVAASLLVKNLGQSWLEGARWFWDTLVDADLPNNSAGWQWTAGCGADAAPYYRIFNPVLQTERFDPHRRYLRRWLPEIAVLPDAWIHKPWEAPPEVWRAAGLTPGKEYPIPAVELRASRDAALQAYETVKAAER